MDWTMMAGQHANRQGAALTVPGLLARVSEEIRAQRAQLGQDLARLEHLRSLYVGRHRRAA